MAVYFLDSSAVVKRYVSEAGTASVADIVDPSAGHRAYVSGVTGPEVVAALSRRSRGRGLVAREAADAISRFRDDLRRLFRVVGVTPQVLGAAMDLAERHGLRGSDAIQLATASEVQRICLARGLACTVLSSDAELNAAAASEGLNVEDPSMRP